MISWSEITREVERRARGRCEYCQMHQSLQGATFHVEHIVPRSQGGTSQLDNLVWACPSCNLHKANRTDVAVPGYAEKTPLFHPRQDRWEDHFAWNGYLVVGVTSVGRVSIDNLQLNHERRIRIRRAEAMFGLFPPTSGDS